MDYAYGHRSAAFSAFPIIVDLRLVCSRIAVKRETDNSVLDDSVSDVIHDLASLRRHRWCVGHPHSFFSVAARRKMVCPTATRPMRVTVP